MEIKAKDIKLVNIDLLVENPKNNNTHPEDQIERLAKLIRHTGFRNPLVVSNRSGFVLCGHGRIAAAKKAGLTELPVIYQDFKDEAEEYQYMTADNAIHNWSSLDLSKIHEDLAELGPFDLDLLGIRDFTLTPEEEDFELIGDIDFTKEVDEKNDYIVLLFTEKEMFNRAKELFKIKKILENPSSSGNALFEKHGLGRIVMGEDYIHLLEKALNE